MSLTERMTWTRPPRRFGIYACSPEESSFTAVFSDLAVTSCAWKAHDGQKPDAAE